MFSASNFYASSSAPSPRTVRRLRRLRRAERQTRLALNSGGDLRPGAAAEAAAARRRLAPDGVPDEFAAFTTQDAALEWLRVNPGSFCAFARELDASGRRSFLCCHPERMLRSLLLRRAGRRHFYEVIPRGAPCKLYFDLEFMLGENPCADGEGAVKILVAEVKKKLHDDFGISCSDSDVVDLDSSTGSKFSRHTIFNIGGAAFADNCQAGMFVANLCQGLDSNSRDKLSFFKDGKYVFL